MTTGLVALNLPGGGPPGPPPRTPKRPGAREAAVLCFAAGGGSATAYRGWADHLPPGVALYAYDLPGRGNRFAEPFATAIDAVVEPLVPVIGALAPRLVLHGHSLGALIAFELTRALAQAGRPSPCHLVVSGRGAPDVPSAGPRLHDRTDDGFVAGLREYGGTPDEVLAHPELLEVLLPMLRADFALSETYAFRPGPPIDVDLVVLGGTEDPTVPIDALAGWGRHSRGQCAIATWPGGHFFLRTWEADIAARIGALALGVEGGW